MGVEASEVTSEVWTRWQGHLINGIFPLGRFLGCSDHSGVFLTRSAALPSDVAIKLVPTNRAQAELQLPRWKRASRLAHPHLLRLLELGGCQLDGLPYLYCVMEYADQTLAQLLQHRALTDDEAREMLVPALDALAFLHGRNLVQGQLKPANILVVGDQLKLASDTIYRARQGAKSAEALTVYDPPEARYGNSSTTGDVWALGLSLFEALTRRPLSSLGAHRDAAVLPADFSPEFRDVVARCLSLSPEDRPSVAELGAWALGQPVSAVPVPSEAPASEAATPEAAAPQAMTPELVAPEVITPEAPQPQSGPPPVAPRAAQPVPSPAPSPKWRALLPVVAGAVLILASVGTAVRVFRTHRAPTPPPVQAPAGSPPQTPGATAPAAAAAQAPVSEVSTIARGPSTVAAPPSAVHEVIPDVPRNARRTIRGHIKVWVRVIVDQDGSVYAAVVDRAGSSKYFRRLAIEAAKQWTFPPVEAPSRRLMQVRFDFSREGTTGRAVALP
jgi:serine/threonine-protein kinase